MVEKNKPKGDFFRAAANIVGNSYAKQAEESCNSSENRIMDLLN